MKNLNKFLSIILVGGMSLSLGSCRDDFADINTPPNALTTLNPSQILTTAELGFNPYDYGIWFFSADNFLKNNQMCGFSGSMTDDRLRKAAGANGGGSIGMLRYLNELKFTLGEEAQSQNACYINAVQVLAIYMGIYDTDQQGDIPYTEAAQYNFGGPMTPKYDKVQDLYNQWNSELKAAVQVFKNPPALEGGYESKQDLAYACDWSKWAKFASSLRVKLATRLIHRDLALAKTIVSEAVADGVMTGPDDDLLFHKADANWGQDCPYDRGDVAFGTTNGTISYQGIVASKKVVDFMMKNSDPRVRFAFTKNSWNSNIVDYYLQNGHKDLMPKVILDMVNIGTDEETGKPKFDSWKGKGEPWVRFVGVPDTYMGNNSVNPEDAQYFKYNDDPGKLGANTILVDGTKYAYSPFSSFQEQYLNQRADKSFPRVPGGEVIIDRDDNPRYDMYMTSAEINLYLAEFAIYGTPGLGAAADYFKTGVKQSVEVWDRLAALNKIPYYGDTRKVSTAEKVIDLQEGEVATLLAQPDYKLTGVKADDIEKIFLNLEFHFLYNPADQFVTGRRSGIPKFNSTLFPRTDYTNAGFPASSFNRRGYFNRPTPTDLMADIISAAYADQGFTTADKANGQGYLNTERLWQDVGAPQWGEGPNVGI